MNTLDRPMFPSAGTLLASSCGVIEEKQSSLGICNGSFQGSTNGVICVARSMRGCGH